jgi:F0F1-type ATP synthase assembly protein I
MAATALVGALLGRLADSWLQSFPLLTLLGVILGLAAGIREILLILRKLDSRDS